MENSERYLAPGRVDRWLNRAVELLAQRGISVWGSRLLEVPGRKTGNPQRVPVNLLRVDGMEYLVAPRGQTHWVRNLRAAGGGHLILGSSRTPFTAREVADADKEPLLRAYLRRWAFEAGRFFDGVTHDAPSGELQRIAGRHPIFRLER